MNLAVLPPDPSPRLAHMEGIIERGLTTFVEVGRSLMAIRDERLYRESHATFETYCKERWGWSHRHANRTIEAAEVAHLLGPIGPTNEAQARELAPLMRENPEAVAGAWQEAVERSEGHPTAAVVQEVVRQGQGRLTALYTSDSDEWFTPPAVVERVVRALSGIDLDPCSNPDAVKVVPAATHYTKSDNGLEYGWRGRVFMNPPYSHVDTFAAKLAEEYRQGNITEAIVLVPARTETRWWRAIPAEVVAFFHGRLRFLNSPDTEAGPATFPSAALYVGPNADAFAAAFADVALVYRRIDA